MLYEDTDLRNTRLTVASKNNDFYIIMYLQQHNIVDYAFHPWWLDLQGSESRHFSKLQGILSLTLKIVCIVDYSD